MSIFTSRLRRIAGASTTTDETMPTADCRLQDLVVLAKGTATKGEQQAGPSGKGTTQTSTLVGTTTQSLNNHRLLLVAKPRENGGRIPVA
jgi:hypothetical protein